MERTSSGLVLCGFNQNNAINLEGKVSWVTVFILSKCFDFVPLSIVTSSFTYFNQGRGNRGGSGGQVALTTWRLLSEAMPPQLQ